MISVQVFDAFNPRSKRSVETVAKIYLMRYLFDYAVQLSSPYDRMNISVGNSTEKNDRDDFYGY